MPNNGGPDWIASRAGQDWYDEDVLRATGWLRSFVPARELELRLDQVRASLLAARVAWQAGEDPALYDPGDAAAWYILQAETFAIDRKLWIPEWAVQIVPFIKRLGKELERLQSVRGVEDRVARMMISDRRQPASGIYELLVALAYRRRGWTDVAFVPETRGSGRTPDLLVSRPRKRWAVECKRVTASAYARREKARGRALAAPIHALSLQTGRSLVVEIQYRTPLSQVPDEYLVERVRQLLDEPSRMWSDEVAAGQVRPVTWRLARKVLDEDVVYFGSSRMVEILTGRFVHEADYSLSAKWRPDPERPFYADAVYHASVVSWTSLSFEALNQKSGHFRKILADADGQLPRDRPGVVHIGIDSLGTPEIGEARHTKNVLEAMMFEPSNPRFRWAYANYFVPELTTRRDESWALTETMAPYRIGRHGTAWPLPGHMLLSPEAESRPGVHWKAPK